MGSLLVAGSFGGIQQIGESGGDNAGEGDGEYRDEGKVEKGGKKSMRNEIEMIGVKN